MFGVLCEGGAAVAVGRMAGERQEVLFVAADAVRALGNPFYGALDALLREGGFDEFAEGVCREFYAQGVGRPSVAPGVYFRMLMVGYLEGIGSERGIAWRCRDSISLREFLGFGLEKAPPDHSTLSKTRKRLSTEAHAAVFGWVLERLGESGLLCGRTVGVDSTTLEANAAMRSIVRRDGAEGYDEWLAQLAAASGISTPTRAELARLDRRRPEKASNKDWVHPHDPQARIAKMKDGRTRLAHKLEAAVDIDTGAVAAVTVQTTDGGDCASLPVTLEAAERNLAKVSARPEEVVADKGYHSNASLLDLRERGLRSYVSEPDRGRRRWAGEPDAKAATYANRRRVRGERGKRLLSRRGEKLERAFAHLLASGGLRRTHVRGHDEIRKRMLIHAAAFNLSLIMRSRVGCGTPRGLQGRKAAAAALAAAAPGGLANIYSQIMGILGLAGPQTGSPEPPKRPPRHKAPTTPPSPTPQPSPPQATSSTAC